MQIGDLVKVHDDLDHKPRLITNIIRGKRENYWRDRYYLDGTNQCYTLSDLVLIQMG